MVIATIITVSLVVSLFTTVFVFVMTRKLAIKGQHELELFEMKRKLAMKTIELEIERARPISSPSSASDVLDDKTKALVRLAVSNPEKQEAESAAMLVCKRLKERIDG